MLLSPGEALTHYRILSTLGSGGMGEVYLAEDAMLGRKVAIKVIRDSIAGDPATLHRLLREARAISALNNANVAQIYEIGEAAGMHFLVLEYVEGKTLRALRGDGSLAAREVVKIGIQVADALAAAQSKGIVHRDLKPANILMTPEGQAKVLDFGLAKVNPDSAETVTELTRAGTVVGTAAYMSPEQALGKEVDHRSDLFSLGIVLYELTAGRAPFQGETATELLVSIVHREPEPLAPADPEIGPRLGTIIHRCLAKDRAQRYQSAAELAADLRALQLESMIRESGMALAPARAGRFWTRRRAMAASAVLPFVLAGGYFAARRLGGGRVTSLAVLPFVNATGDPKLDYVADGLTATLIDDLARRPGLRVLSEAWVRPYRGKPADPLQAGKALGTKAVVSGKLEGSGGSLRIQADLVDTASGAEIWGHAYTRELMAVLSVQQEIAREVSQRLHSPPEAAPAASEARQKSYDLYLRAVHEENKQSAEGIRNGMALLQQAVQADPTFALPQAHIAFNTMQMANVAAQPTTALLPRVREAAAKALALDPEQVDAHCVMGFVEALDFNWQAAENEFQRALAVNPYHAWSHQWYALFVLAPQGRIDQALTEIDRAIDATPQSPARNLLKGEILRYARRRRDAIRQFQAALALDPNFLFTHLRYGAALIDDGKYDDAIAQMNTPPYHAGGNVRQLTLLAYAYAAAGKRRELAPLLNEIEQREKEVYVPPYSMARIYAALGQKDRAGDWLERAYQERDMGIGALNVDPSMDTLRAEPRSIDLLRKMHLRR